MKTHYRIEITAAKFWLLFLPGIALSFAMFIFVGYFAVDRLVMPKVVGSKSRWDVTIPALVGIPLDSAKQMCHESGLRLSERRTEYNDSIPSGVVISQEPEIGSSAKQGRHVLVVVSKGPEIAVIPSVKDMQEGPAKRVLRSAGFTNIAVTSTYHSAIGVDKCIDTDPSQGIITSREARVTILLSKGKKPVNTVVPDLLGEKLSDAKSALEAAGLVLGSLTYESQADVSPGIVIRQSQAAGASVPLESQVSLVISIE